MTFDEIVAAVREERAYQDAKWGGIEHDLQHSFMDWEGFIREHADQISQTSQPRHELVVVAALAFAALEAQEGE